MRGVLDDVARQKFVTMKRLDSLVGVRTAQGVVVRHYRSEHPMLCPVEAAQECLLIRERWITAGVVLGPYLTSTSRRGTIKKAVVAKLIKEAAKAWDYHPRTTHVTHYA